MQAYGFIIGWQVCYSLLLSLDFPVKPLGVSLAHYIDATATTQQTLYGHILSMMFPRLNVDITLKNIY